MNRFRKLQAFTQVGVTSTAFGVGFLAADTLTGGLLTAAGSCGALIMQAFDGRARKEESAVSSQQEEETRRYRAYIIGELRKIDVLLAEIHSIRLLITRILVMVASYSVAIALRPLTSNFSLQQNWAIVALFTVLCFAVYHRYMGGWKRKPRLLPN